MAIPESKSKEKYDELDKRLFVTPALALSQAKASLLDMADTSKQAMDNAIKTINNYSDKAYEKVCKIEDKNDHYEDIIGTYLVELSSKNTLNEAESKEVSKMLKVIDDLERLADHAINIAQDSKELRTQNLSLSEEAIKELDKMTGAVNEIVDLAIKAFKENSLEIALKIAPLEEVVDGLKESLRANHIDRVKKGECSIETGFIWTDLIINLERVGDHCNDIGAEIIDDLMYDNRYIHKTKRHASEDKDFDSLFKDYSSKYSL